MNTTQRYLTRLEAKSGTASGYANANLLGVTHQAIYSYKNGKRQMNDKVATKMANYLGIDPVKVVAEVQLEQANNSESRQLWQRILDLSNTAQASKANKACL